MTMGPRIIASMLCWMLLGANWISTTARAAGQADGAIPSGLYDQLVNEYLSGNFEKLEKDLATKNPELGKLTGQQKIDVQYIRTTSAECRPAWWRQSKSNQEFNFRPGVLGHALRATYDPKLKSDWNLRFTNGSPSVTFKWNSADMDNPAEAEHGFSKGDLCDLDIWSLIGSADARASVPIQLQLNMNDAQKLQLQRFTDFSGHLVGIYYGTPTARRWGLWLFCASYLEKYATMATVNSRKAVGAMFLAELVSAPDKYPSIKLPATLPDDSIEENLCIALKNAIEKTPWTLAEDELLRERIKACWIMNQKGVAQSGIVKLPNGQSMALDPALDAANQAARDAWLKQNRSPAR